ncbi:MAG: hypothetical protein CFE25_08750 [Chitinophagaceae bacterium BSSC1]|nr:MAG: hypothetical protein CFE25_08750 [Chitinophagaceae bacterium BSSC1]
MKLFFSLLTICFCLTAQSQEKIFHYEGNDSIGVYNFIQTEINKKEIGSFEYKLYSDTNQVYSKIIIKNFYPKEEPSKVWSIISKIDYGNKSTVLRKSYWKTNNLGTVCMCNVWFKKRGRIGSLETYHPRCEKIKLNCDSQGRFATR